MVSGHVNLRHWPSRSNTASTAPDGTPVEFGVIACCDGVTDNHAGAHYVLPSRENIADAIEIQARAHRLDGLVLLASCDKIHPRHADGRRQAGHPLRLRPRRLHAERAPLRQEDPQ